jgi:large subunit ribosomal protein L28
MARSCDLTGTKVQFGNNVSHSKRKTRRKFLPNVQAATFESEYLGKLFLKVTSRTLRTVDYKGGIDQFLLKASNRNLSESALKLKRKVKKLIAKKIA